MYNPQDNLLEGIRMAFPLQLFPWDEYFARMAEVDFFSRQEETLGVKSYFIRKSPFEGSFALLGGITTDGQKQYRLKEEEFVLIEKSEHKTLLIDV